MPAFMSKVYATNIYRNNPAYSGIFKNQQLYRHLCGKIIQNL